jgi:hypothetical protein
MSPRGDAYRWISAATCNKAIEGPCCLMDRTSGTRSRNIWLEERISDEVVRELKRHRRTEGSDC